MPTKPTVRSSVCCGSGKFIAWIGFILATFALAGVIVVVADKTTCGVAPVPTPYKGAKVPSVQTTEPLKTQGAVLAKVSTVCFGDVKDLDEFKKLVTIMIKDEDFDSTNIYPALQDDLDKGWAIHAFCFLRGNASVGSDYVFAMRKLQGVTEADIKSVAKVVNFNDKMPTMAEFKGDSLFSLIKFKYAGYMPDLGPQPGPGGREIIDSKPLAVNGGPNQPGTVSSLSAFFDQKTVSTGIMASMVGGDYDVYYSKVTFVPASQELTIGKCMRIGVGKELGDKWEFTCK